MPNYALWSCLLCSIGQYCPNNPDYDPMEKQFPNLFLRVPADCIGEVLGELNSRRALILGMKHKDDVCTVEANLPNEEIASYREWFEKFTNGKGEMIAH